MKNQKGFTLQSLSQWGSWNESGTSVFMGKAHSTKLTRAQPLESRLSIINQVHKLFISYPLCIEKFFAIAK
jgi:hypothetical protein